jgi:lipopolysaccharide biosynthesis glycosyltransferase
MKTMVVTGCMGPATQYMEYTVPTVEAYAKRIGSDYFFIGNHNRKFPDEPKFTYEKFQIEDMLKNGYDRVLWIDCDVVVKPDLNVSLFDEVPFEKVGALWDGKGHRKNGTKRRLKREIREIQEGLGDLGWELGYFNAGVMLFSSCHMDMFKDGFQYALPHKCWTWNDQSVFNYHCVKYDVPVHGLDFKWNAMNNNCSYEYLVNESCFAHFSGRIQKRKMGKFIDSLKQFHEDIA